MAVQDRIIRIGLISIRQLILVVATPCSVEITQIVEGRGPVILSRRTNGVILDGPFDEPFIVLPARLAIPWGTIRASRTTGAPDLVFRYRVRTGSDVTGRPEFNTSFGRAA